MLNISGKRLFIFSICFIRARVAMDIEGHIQSVISNKQFKYMKYAVSISRLMFSITMRLILFLSLYSDIMQSICFLQLCLTVDHPQKVLMLGEAMDFGTCKAKKKNGDSCTQLVNLVTLPLLESHVVISVGFVFIFSPHCQQYECQYCQYHVKAQYKKISSKRAELQSSYTGTAPRKGKGSGSLRERLCQSDFHYGGLSSLACAPSM